MTDEQNKECNCKCECYKIAAKFLLLTTSVFVGTLLAIIFAAHLLKPAIPPCDCHRGMHKMPPRMERFDRQLPPQGAVKLHKQAKFYAIENGGQRDLNRTPQKPGKPDFKRGDLPQKPENPVKE